MSMEDANAGVTLGNQIISTVTAMGTTVTAGAALAVLGTVGASNAFLALPGLLPAILVGFVAASKFAHAVMLHNHADREKEKTDNSLFGNVQTASMTSLRNRELFSGLGLGGVAAGASLVANHTAPYTALGMAGGLSAGLALASLGLTINAIQDAYFAWCCYKAIEIPKLGVKNVRVWNQVQKKYENTEGPNNQEIKRAKQQQEVARRAMHSSIVAALGWAAVTTGSVAATMSLVAPIWMAAAFLLGSIAITGARLYNNGYNFGLFNKKVDSSMDFSTRLEISSIQHGL